MKILINTEDELKQLTGVSMALSIESLTPHLAFSWAEDQLIAILGQELYESLLNAYADATLEQDANAKLKALLHYAQKPLAALAVYSFMQEGGVMISDQGITADRDRSAFQWQQVKAEKHYLENAYRALDRLITFLLANKGDYPTWADTAYHFSQGSLLIPSPALFNEHINIRSSYRTFVALIPHLRQVQERQIASLLGDAFLADVLAKIEDEKYKDLLKYLRPALAFLSMAEAIEVIHIELTGDGALLYSLRTNVGNIQEQHAPASSELARSALRYQERGRSWLQDLRAHLNANASAEKYPLYFTSDQYEDPALQGQSYQQDFNSNLFNGL